MVYCASKLIENLKLFYKTNKPQLISMGLLVG